MKKQIRIFNIDEEKLKKECDSHNDSAIRLALFQIKENVWIFNMTYDPQKEGGYMTSKQPMKISENFLATYQSACEAIGARLEIVGPDVF